MQQILCMFHVSERSSGRMINEANENEFSFPSFFFQNKLNHMILFANRWNVKYRHVRNGIHHHLSDTLFAFLIGCYGCARMTSNKCERKHFLLYLRTVPDPIPHVLTFIEAFSLHFFSSLNIPSRICSSIVHIFVNLTTNTQILRRWRHHHRHIRAHAAYTIFTFMCIHLNTKMNNAQSIIRNKY